MREISTIAKADDTVLVVLSRNIVSYLLLFSVFVSGNGIQLSDVTFYWYYPLYVFLLLYGVIRFNSFNRNFLGVMFLLIVHSVVVYVFNERSGGSLMIKQIVNVLLSAGVFFFYLKSENYDLIEIFRKYTNVAKLITVIGLVQVLLFIVERGELFLLVFPIKSNISFRFQSVTLEPSVVAYTFAPVFFLSLYNIFTRRSFLIGRHWSILFILSYLLTLSAIAYIGVVVALVILYFNRITYRKLGLAAFALLAISILAYIPYRLMPEIRMRVDDTFYGLNNDFTQREVYTSVNASSYAILSNLYVASQSVRENPWLGNGIGTHEQTYDKFLPLDAREYSSLNRKDANSLALRLVTETGFVGLGLFLFFLFRFRLRYVHALSSDEHKILWILNAGILIMLLLSLLRNGNYTIQGKLMFLFMYYYSFRFVHGDHVYPSQNTTNE